MPTPAFVLDIRQKIGHDPLWLSGITVVVLRLGTENDQEVLLVRPASTSRWTLIGGTIEPGEDPDQAAAREVFEETKVEVEITKLLWIQALPETVLGTGDIVQYLDIAFLARPIRGQAGVGDDESEAVGWFPLNATPRLIPRHAEILESLSASSEGVCFGRDGRRLPIRHEDYR